MEINERKEVITRKNMKGNVLTRKGKGRGRKMKPSPV
jgi:hypothetical protein